MKKVTKSYYIATITACLLIMMTITSCSEKHDSPPTQGISGDVIIEETDLKTLSQTSPKAAMLKIDSLQDAGKLQQWRADSMRARVLSESFLDMNKSMLYAKRVIQYDSIRLIPHRYLDMLTFISRTELTLGHYSECIKHCLEGAKVADSINDSHSSQYLNIMIGSSMYMMKNKTKGLEYLHRAANELEESSNVADMKLLSYAYGQLMTAYWSDNTPKAIEAGLRREALLSRLEQKCEAKDSNYIDREKGFLYSKMADFYARNYDRKTAEKYEKKYYSTRFSNSVRGKQAILDYYSTIGDADKFLARCRESSDYWLHKDTICSRYSNVLLMLSTAYAIKGDYEEALNYRTRQKMVRDSLSERENENEAIRFAALYGTQEKELALEKKRTETVRARTISLATLLLFLSALAFAIYWYRQHKSTTKKNVLLVKQLDELNYYQQLYHEQEEKSQSKTKRTTTKERKSSETSDKISENIQALVKKFNKLIDEDQEFLKSDFSRIKLQQMLNLSKNGLTPVLHAAIGENTNLSDFITDKRIHYACELIKSNPNYTIERVAMESGFYTTRNFRRCFSDKVGMSPSEYKEACAKINE